MPLLSPSTVRSINISRGLARGESLNNGDGEREGLASAGLRRGHNIAACQRRLNGLLLYGCGFSESVLQEVGL